MNKSIKKIFIIVTLLILGVFLFPNIVNAISISNTTNNYIRPSKNSSYKDYSYVINSYNVDIIVNENNTYDIEETIDAYFNISKHGIFRTIPLSNTVVRLDGTTEKNQAKISNVKVNDKYTTSRENGNYKIKIGSSNITLTGEKKYQISYNYNIGKDKNKNYDELYFNIIGSAWDTVIGNISFKITMPKAFDKTKLGFSSGSIGSTDSSNITYTVEGNIITGVYHGVLEPGNSLTVRLELPDGYFINAGYQANLYTYLFFIVPVVCLLITLLIWFIFGKDDKVTETVEFYPPEGFNSLEIGYLYKGTADSKDVTSLLIYLANKGYIKIIEKDSKVLFSDVHDFKIVKLKEYDGDNYSEQQFLEGLFKYSSNSKSLGEDNKYENLPTITQNNLSNRFYKTMNKILGQINSKENKKQIFESSSSFKTIMPILMIILSLVTILTIPTLEYADFDELAMTLVISLFYTPFYAVGLSKTIPRAFRFVWLGFTIFHSSIFFSTLPIGTALRDDYLLLLGFILGIICILGMITLLKAMPKRTKYGNEILGKIKGFKTFLETAEKNNINALVMQEPSYFYDILPYAYVLGVSDKWISKFEAINMQEPDWYSSSSTFSVHSFGKFMTHSLASTQSAMSSSPSSSSGGSSGRSSGGGSSGRGSGGGGGGSW